MRNSHRIKKTNVAPFFLMTLTFDLLISWGLYMTFWKNCRVNASHFGKRSLGAFLQWVTQNCIFMIFLCFTIWYLILYFYYNKIGFVWIQIIHLLFTFIYKTLTMSYLTWRFVFTSVRRWGAMRHQKRLKNRQNVWLSTWSVLQLLFA